MAVLGSAVAFTAACGDNLTAGDTACNPLGGQGCLLPWPSMAYVTTDATSATGYRLALPRGGMPVNADGIVLEPDNLNRWDGFSMLAPMLAMFPTGVSAQGLPSHKDPEQSLAASSPIVLLEIETGERVPLFAEIDQNTLEIEHRALIIRPLARLKPSSRYAVAIRNTVKAADGGELPVSPAFAALRDGTEFAHPRFANLARGATAMFDALAAAGVERGELVLAWDFVTASNEFIRSDLTRMRDAALPAIGPDGAKLKFTMTEERPNTAQTYKRYLGTFESPDFLTDGERDASVLRRGPDGLPVMRGMRDAPFAALIPKCVETEPLPRPTVVFGHGLFGSSKEYLDDGFVADLANDHCLVIIAGDFIGLTSRQFSLAPLAINDLNRGPQITEKLTQSVIDFIALESVARGPMASSPAFRYQGAAVIDPARTFYIGGSLGGIMGNTFMAYDPNLTRGVLAVPGGNWSLLLERSTAWSLLIGAAQGAYEDPAVYQLLLSMGLGMGFEPIDPMSTAAHVIADPLFGNPVKNILMWYAIGDSLVTNISTEMVAREMGIDLLGPSVKEPWRLPAKTGPLANGITVYDERRTPVPADTNVPPGSDNGTHSGVNKRPAVMRQVEQFLLHDTAINECRDAGGAPAPCDCTTNACN